ncbi:hypothetical protein LIER_07992 [Lithospermum erythrorhizon]|uniref:Uncharacterized protein n=1 Tax=Lithospermum erythrorhizon TaxID=34254 RepID=A0AAV3PA74_LITER
MHYIPWLTCWWNTQQLFPQPSEDNVAHYLDIMSTSNHTQTLEEYSTQQGVYESYMRDLMVFHGDWEFDPLDLEI